MRRFIGIIFCAALIASCYSVERNCQDFHRGTFQFQQIIGEQLQTSTFLRSENLEIEYYNSTIDSASIRWINPCECVLTKLNPVSNQDKRPISIKILTTNDNEYVFEYTLVGDQKNKQRGKIVKLSDELITP
ncbi:MAG: DNA topoisomerase IV [Flavobacteriaceae bacterium]|nr:DNA topoisomerase IV [Flavobacteriaceae bacterium]